MRAWLSPAKEASRLCSVFVPLIDFDMINWFSYLIDLNWIYLLLANLIKFSINREITLKNNDQQQNLSVNTRLNGQKNRKIPTFLHLFWQKFIFFLIFIFLCQNLILILPSVFHGIRFKVRGLVVGMTPNLFSFRELRYPSRLQASIFCSHFYYFSYFYGNNFSQWKRPGKNFWIMEKAWICQAQNNL